MATSPHPFREGIRRDLAQFKLIEMRLAEVTAELRRAEQSKDAAADRHQAVCGPLQERLSAVERQITDEFVAKREPTPKLLATRKDVLQQIATANDELALTIAATDKRIQTLRDERERVAHQLATKPVRESDMIRTAPQHVLDRIEVLKAAVRGLHLRAKGLRKQVAAIETSISESRRRAARYGRSETPDMDYLRTKLRQTELALDDCEGDARGKQAELDELLRQALED